MPEERPAAGGAGAPGRPRPRVLPTSVLGWVALAMTAAFLPLFYAVVYATGWLRTTAPVLANTGVVPIMLVVFIDVAAALGVVAVARGRDHSVLTVAATAVAVGVAVFATAFAVGSVLAPAAG